MYKELVTQLLVNSLVESRGVNLARVIVIFPLRRPGPRDEGLLEKENIYEVVTRRVSLTTSF